MLKTCVGHNLKSRKVFGSTEGENDKQNESLYQVHLMPSFPTRLKSDWKPSAGLLGSSVADFSCGGYYLTIDLCGFRSESKMTSKFLKAFKLCWPAYNMGFAKCGLQNIKSAVGFQSNICKLALRFVNLRPTELTEHRVPQIAKPRALSASRSDSCYSPAA